MAQTGVLGTSDSYLANFVLGVVASAASPPPPPVSPPGSTDGFPFVPPGGRLGLPIGYSFAPVSALPSTLKLRLKYPENASPGAASAAASAAQVYMPPFPRTAIIRGPWQDSPFRPEGKNVHVTVPAPPDPQVLPIPFPSGAPVRGPWNLFGRGFVPGGFGPPGGTVAPVPPPVGPPPPPPPPQAGVIGGARVNVPKIPVDIDLPQGRMRAHTQKVAGLLNSLLRQGYIRLVGQDDYAIVGGAFALPRAPVASDDMTKGAVVGGTYVDTLNNDVYICTNNSVGSAIWRKISLS